MDPGAEIGSRAKIGSEAKIGSRQKIGSVPPRVGQGGWGATSGSAAEAPMTAKNLRSTQHTAGGTRQAPSP